MQAGAPARLSATWAVHLHPHVHARTRAWAWCNEHPPKPLQRCCSQHVSAFVEWLVGQLRRPSNDAKAVPTATSCLAALLKERGVRALFLRAGGVQSLPPLLKSANTPTNSQLLYELCLCVWQMTYVAGAAEVMGAPSVKALVDICRSAQKEKVFRIAMSSLKNLLAYEDLALASDMVEAGLPKVVATRSLQQWGDEDIGEMLSFMDEKLKEGIQVGAACAHS